MKLDVIIVVGQGLHVMIGTYFNPIRWRKGEARAFINYKEQTLILFLVFIHDLENLIKKESCIFKLLLIGVNVFPFCGPHFIYPVACLSCELPYSLLYLARY